MNKGNFWIPHGGGIQNPPSDIVDDKDKWKFIWSTLCRWQQRILRTEKERRSENLS